MIQIDPRELESINGRVLNLVQAMLGLITPTFRSVSIELVPKKVILHFLLERDSDIDKEQIEDIALEYQALEVGFPDSREVELSVVASADQPALLNMPGRLVFNRWEEGT